MILIDQGGTIYNDDHIVYVGMQESMMHEGVWYIYAKLSTDEYVELASYSDHDKCQKEFTRYRKALWDDRQEFIFKE